MSAIGVTGSDGTLGKALIRHLAARGARVLALSRERPFGLGPFVEHLPGDIRDPSALEVLAERSDGVIHLAGRNPGDDEAEDRQDLPDFLQVNALSTALLAALLGARGKRLVLASSVAVYELGIAGRRLRSENEALPGDVDAQAWIRDALKALPQGPSVVTAFALASPPPEGAPAFALSKLLAERAAERCSDRVILRLGDAYGPGHEPRGIIGAALDLLVKGRAARLDFGRRAEVSFTYMGDALRALAAAVSTRELWTGCVNVASPERINAAELARSLREACAAVALDARVSAAGPDKPLHARVLKTDRLESLLSPASATPLAAGLGATIEYLLSPPPERERFKF